MGTFKVNVKLSNWQNRFLPEEKRGESVECLALVDTGAAELALPSETIEKLKLEELGAVRVYTADGAEHQYRVFGIVEVEVQGRNCHVRAIELPYGAEPLLGSVPLEEMDWHVSPQEKKLVPNPRSPESPLLPPVLSRPGRDRDGIAPCRRPSHTPERADPYSEVRRLRRAVDRRTKAPAD